MKRKLRWALVAIALPGGLALAGVAALVHFKKLPGNFWTLPLSEKWTALRALLTNPRITFK